MEKADPNAKATVQQMPGGEQGAELQAILKEAQQGGAGQAPGAPTAAQVNADEVEKWAALPLMFGSLVSPIMPELRGVFSPENCKAWGAAMVPVARKYSINADSFVGVELSLAMATIPFVGATVIAIKSRRGTLAETLPKADGDALCNDGHGPASQ